jgi:hypothetical protein
MVSALGGLSPTAAQQAFGAQFCAECALGVPGCESTLFSGEGDTAVAGKIILPLSDTLVNALATECAVGATCAGTFLSCAQNVIVQQALPEQTVQCLLDTLAGNLPADQQSPCGAGTGGAGTGGTGATGGTGGTAGAGGGGDLHCDEDWDEPANDVEATAPELGMFGDCDGDSDLYWLDLPAGDVDWYFYRGRDGMCQVNPWVEWETYYGTGSEDVCMFFECDGLAVTCPSGTTEETSPEGRPGCCGVTSFEADIDCSGMSDDALVYIRVTNSSTDCQQGTVDFHY